MYGPSTRRQKALGGGIKTEVHRCLVVCCRRNNDATKFKEIINRVGLEEDGIVRAWEYMRKISACYCSLLHGAHGAWRWTRETSGGEERTVYISESKWVTTSVALSHAQTTA